MKELMIMYHPVKKEIRFLAKVKGEFLDIPYNICPNLLPYSPEHGEFLLQNQGNQFFNDIWEQFLHEKISLVFKGTKIDYDDFLEKIAEYNRFAGEERFVVSNFIELPSVADIYKCISDFCDDTLAVFDSELKDSEIVRSFQLRKEEFKKKREQLNANDVNLCLVGTYSSGKSTFINTLIGKRILPESINSETAKMFRIQNNDKPSVSFRMKTPDTEGHILVTIAWDIDKKKFAFYSNRGECPLTKQKIQNEINSALVFHLQQHEQLYQILKTLNDIPNAPTEDYPEYIDGIIEVNYPIPLDPNINFTFYDTPGTDSNSNEHLLVLQNALQQQTNSILIILYEPTKMEGTGNSILYKLIRSSREDKETKDKVHIDLTRSLHVINQADTRSLADLNNLKDKKVGISLKETDKIYNEEAEYIDLSKERLFFVSSKAAYISKAIAGNIDTEDERLWLANHRNEINNTPTTDPLLIKGDNQEIETGMYFKLDKMASADNETKQLIADCMEELRKCDPSDTSLRPILQRIYINSGMYAIEREIVKYAQKYALAVKAKGLYDSISSVVDFIRDDYAAIETQARLSKEQISQNIDTMKTTMVADIDRAYADYLTTLTPEFLLENIPDIASLNSIIESRKAQAAKIADKMKWIAIRPEVFEEKNNIIRQELNLYLMEIDDFYKANRESILKKQIEALRASLVKAITGYKGIDEGLVRRIANVSDTQVPPSSLKALRMDEYINKQKAIFIFSTNDKTSYKKDIEEMFSTTTRQQYESYVAEILEVAKAKSAELVAEFKNNIDMISSNLEFLIKDEKRAISMQAKAKAVLDLVAQKDNELNKKIWSEI
ncbi:MAG: dynamin family protein [Lachnospiraceae bacterium]|nr:dynamin family protein [Lachnospiraceae bacterium]